MVPGIGRKPLKKSHLIKQHAISTLHSRFTVTMNDPVWPRPKSDSILSAEKMKCAILRASVLDQISHLLASNRHPLPLPLAISALIWMAKD